MQGCDGSTLAGALFWQVADEGYPDYDGFTVHVPGTALNMSQSNPTNGKSRNDVEGNCATWKVLQRWAVESTDDSS
jgi:hypothetical protein